MFVRLFTAAAALAAAVAVSAGVRRYRGLHRELSTVRASSRLTAGCLHRDLAALHARVDLALAQGAVVDDAGLVLDEALATYSTDTDLGGGPA